MFFVWKEQLQKGLWIDSGISRIGSLIWLEIKALMTLISSSKESMASS